MTGPLPPAVCIVTPVEDPVRFAEAQAHFADRDLEGVRYFHGLHKSQSGLNTDYTYEVDNPDSGFKMGPAPTHIWLAHYFAWQALKLSGDPWWLILECDAKLPENWPKKVAEAWAALPEDAEVGYVGSCCCTGHPVTAIAGSWVRLAGTAPQCDHAYWLKTTAVATLERTLRRVWAPIDIQRVSECFEGGELLTHGHSGHVASPRLRAYTHLPRLVEQWNTYIPT